MLSPDRSSQGWLEYLKLSDAQCCHWSAQPSVFFLLFASLFLLFPVFIFFFSLFLSMSYLSFLFSIHVFKAIRSHGCSIPLPPSSDCLLQLRLDFPVSVLSSGPQGVAICPPTNCLALPRQLDSSITSWNVSSATLVVKLDVKFL